VSAGPAEPGKPPTAVRLRIRGRVQGVGFRWFVCREARELGLSGRVKNLPDGSVEVLASGNPETLAKLRERLRQGPPSGRVEGIEEQELASVPGWEGFEIDR
jgi:acylphosphatase